MLNINSREKRKLKKIIAKYHKDDGSGGTSEAETDWMIEFLEEILNDQEDDQNSDLKKCTPSDEEPVFAKLQRCQIQPEDLGEELREKEKYFTSCLATMEVRLQRLEVYLSREGHDLVKYDGIPDPTPHRAPGSLGSDPQRLSLSLGLKMYRLREELGNLVRQPIYSTAEFDKIVAEIALLKLRT
jgi:hypothetical protein